ncbi:pentapeptide repeat protein [Rippkaea orientalis PCC 8801]|uniref:Pentapeptide repeat protein n=1 Tax=Rippkaea orientalis (strain PCC 8801 / RF-1) TaxID=41431 RepID=B7K604_RIPO1|nr:pentapeptide repeat-containing protein [Rippkaea orientalis]ACK68057.1 pentapeptide repeat protein [Rippkaea orientalis PCC 8801]
MKASQLLQQYEQGRRDFRGEDLRGQSFRGKNLAHTDFSQADIRGTNFTQANLTGAKFCQAKGGLTKPREILLGLISFLLAGLSGIFSGLSGGLVLLIFDSSHLINQIVGWTALIILMIFCIFSYYQGLTGGVAAATLSFMGTLVVALVITQEVSISVTTILYIGVIFIGHVAVALAGALTGALAGAFAGATVGAVIGVGAFPLAIIFALALAEANDKLFSIAGAVTAVIILSLLSIYLGLRAMKGDNRDSWLRHLAFAFSAIGGTSFYRANLTNADLTGALLKGTDLRDADLTRTRFYQAQQLNRARVDNTILAQPEIRDLLIDPTTGYKQYYYKANLRGANLDYANLHGANLKQADLTDATLRHANLEGANLTKILASGTDFSGATFHGVCIEGWKIDVFTKLGQVDCEYVFLREKPNEYGSRERCPYDPEGKFEPGDFELLYKVRNYAQAQLED